MLPVPLHQRMASTYAKRAQIGFVTLGVGATALAAYSLRTPAPVETPSLTLPAPAPGKQGPGKLARAGTIDAAAVDKRMHQLANYPTAPETPTTGPEETPPELPAATEESVKFLGALVEPTRRVALLKINDRQRLLGPGESEGDVSVVRVTDDHVDIMLKGSTSQTLTKQARSGPTVNQVAASPSAPAMGAEPPPPSAPPLPGGRGKRGLGANRAGDDPAVAAEHARRAREAAGDRP